MGDSIDGADLRRRREMAGLSQRALAVRAQVPQPNIAAYESGRRSASSETARRLNAALKIPTMERVRSAREIIIASALERHLRNIRVFGSVARGSASAGSDVDLLVEPGPDASTFDLAAFMADVAETLGVDVDVVSDRGTGPRMDRIRAEAVPI